MVIVVEVVVIVVVTVIVVATVVVETAAEGAVVVSYGNFCMSPGDGRSCLGPAWIVLDLIARPPLFQHDSLDLATRTVAVLKPSLSNRYFR